MNKSINRLALNRQTAPKLSIIDFLKLAHESGFKFVELRNDLPPYYSVCDNYPIEEIKHLLEQYEISVITINAVGSCNWQKNEADFVSELENICQVANELGCTNLVLCPACKPDGIFLNESESDLFDETNYEINTIIEPIFKKYNIKGFFEPLGFAYSSFRDFSSAIKIVNNNPERFKIVFDTFHFYLFDQIGKHNRSFNLSLPELQSYINNLINHIGLVHLSSVIKAIPTDKFSDDDRVLIHENNDILKSIEQIKLLESLGYDGIYSLEPFSPEYHSKSYIQLKELLEENIKILDNHLTATH